MLFLVFREINFNLRNNFCCQVFLTEAENHSFSCGHNNFLNFLGTKSAIALTSLTDAARQKKRPIHLPNGEVSDRLRGADCAVGVCRRKAQNICDFPLPFSFIDFSDDFLVSCLALLCSFLVALPYRYFSISHFASFSGAFEHFYIFFFSFLIFLLCFQ